eukprot:365524-Chlamydomonas_euryale.AAC.4
MGVAVVEVVERILSCHDTMSTIYIMGGKASERLLHFWRDCFKACAGGLCMADASALETLKSMAYTSPGAKSVHASARTGPGRTGQALGSMSSHGVNKSNKECRPKIAPFRMPARRIRHERNGDGVTGVQLSEELFEHAGHGMCWIMASVVGDDACCAIGCTKEKVHVALKDAWSSNCKLMRYEKEL